MKWASLLVVLAGCVPLEPVASSPNRLAVTDRLRTACADSFWSGDGVIFAILAQEEVNRTNGVTFNEQVATLGGSCSTESCFQCRIEILDQIYGRP